MTYSYKEIARVCHEANRALQHIQYDPAPSPHWDEAPDWQQESAINGVQKALEGATPQQLHESWCEAKKAAGWRFGEIKNSEEKTHPCLLPYDQLSEQQKIKDTLFYSIVAALGDFEL